jgi:hypothetical protein
VTPFAAILRRAVETTPNAIGGAFADPDGEMVDSYATIDKHEWAVLTAHYGVILRQLTDAFGTWHFGGPEYFIAQHRALEVIVQVVESGYYALLAFARVAPVALALENLKVAAKQLRKEMA